MASLTRRDFIFATATGVAATALSLRNASGAPGDVPASAPAPVPVPTSTPAASGEPKRTVGMVVFDGFQLLDVFGPLEMFSLVRGKVAISLLAEKIGPVKSGAGPVVMADRTLADAGALDLVMIPGGGGTRREVNNPSMIAALKALAESTPRVASVCTGSAVLARTGLLDGRRATTNKQAYKWATSQGAQVNWVPEARWVEDGKFVTSSGISAGMDMALAIIAQWFDLETAKRAANSAEYEWHMDAHWDPFAKLNGLVK